MKDISIIIEQSFLFQFDFFLPFGLAISLNAFFIKSLLLWN